MCLATVEWDVNEYWFIRHAFKLDGTKNNDKPDIYKYHIWKTIPVIALSNCYINVIVESYIHIYIYIYKCIVIVWTNVHGVHNCCRLVITGPHINQWSRYMSSIVRPYKYKIIIERTSHPPPPPPPLCSFVLELNLLPVS